MTSNLMNVHELICLSMTHIWADYFKNCLVYLYNTFDISARSSTAYGIDCREVCSSVLCCVVLKEQLPETRHKTFVMRLYDHQASWQFIWGHETCWRVISRAHARAGNHRVRWRPGFAWCSIASLIEFISQCINIQCH